MNAQQWLITILLGMVMGLVGQGLRVGVGLKKAKDTAAAQGQQFADQFEPATLLISLLYGAAAGAVAAITTIVPDKSISVDSMFALAGAGYAGADFLEGVMDKYFPGKSGNPLPAVPAIPAHAPVGVPSPPPVASPGGALTQEPAPVKALPKSS